MSSNSNNTNKILKILAKNRAVAIDTLKQDGDKKTNYALLRSIKNLAQVGLVEIHNSGKQKYIRLTQKGKNKLNCIKLYEDEAIVSASWDGYWRIIIIDLPEERKNEREALRYLLKKAGFVCIKNSVWISIYPFENLFTNIKKDLGFTTEMIIIVTDKVDEMTQKQFFLSCGTK